MLPVLTVFADAVAIGGAALYSSPALNVTPAAYISQTLALLTPGDIWQGIAKAFVFAVLICLIGVSTGFGVTDALADPLLELHNSDGDLIDSNDNWMDNPNMQTISDKGLAPSDPNEAALYEVLPAGLYTAILSGVGDTTGIGLVETYDADPPIATPAH